MKSNFRWRETEAPEVRGSTVGLCAETETLGGLGLVVRVAGFIPNGIGFKSRGRTNGESAGNEVRRNTRVKPDPSSELKIKNTARRKLKNPRRVEDLQKYTRKAWRIGNPEFKSEDPRKNKKDKK
eukprot:GHVO01015631.1.p2 GENE.GHVO01015631.1~~GHVO01015631.1.p2  ORF type:complete len:125 (-),score=4.19 GHVO01015631.1:19-393(-)